MIVHRQEWRSNAVVMALAALTGDAGFLAERRQHDLNGTSLPAAEAGTEDLAAWLASIGSEGSYGNDRGRDSSASGGFNNSDHESASNVAQKDLERGHFWLF